MEAGDSGQKERKPRVLSPRQVRWMLNWYPPLLFQRIRIKHVAEDMRSARVEVRRSLLTRNLNGTTFGGTIFSGCDPVYPVLYWQVFAREGELLQVWLKTASVNYKKPASTTLTLDFEISDDDVAAVRSALDEHGKTVHTHVTEACDAQGHVCAVIESAIYLRRIGAQQKEVSGF